MRDRQQSEVEGMETAQDLRVDDMAPAASPVAGVSAPDDEPKGESMNTAVQHPEFDRTIRREDALAERKRLDMEPATFNYEESVPQRVHNIPAFNAIWDEIKTWDVNVPTEYAGYCGASGSHVYAILKALRDAGVIRFPPDDGPIPKNWGVLAQPSAEGDGLLPQELVEGIAWWKDGKNADSFTETGLRDFIDALIENLPRKGAEGDGWIAVKRKLPTEGEESRVPLWLGNLKYPYEPSIVYGYYEAGRWWSQWGELDGDEVPTLWYMLPLPAPVAKEGRES